MGRSGDIISDKGIEKAKLGIIKYVAEESELKLFLSINNNHFQKLFFRLFNELDYSE